MKRTTNFATPLFFGFSLVLAACSPAGATQTAQLDAAALENTATSEPQLANTAAEVTDTPSKTAASTDTPQIASNPVIPTLQHELSEEEYHWNQLLRPDDILPIYDPEFTTAEQAPYTDEELVIGVEINGEAKAYAIGPLNSREMVNDTVGGTPVLVTW
jgi:hypothetical protein